MPWVWPELLESIFVKSPLIYEICLIGDKKKFVVAIVKRDNNYLKVTENDIQNELSKIGTRCN